MSGKREGVKPERHPNEREKEGWMVYKRGCSSLLRVHIRQSTALSPYVFIANFFAKYLSKVGRTLEKFNIDDGRPGDMHPRHTHSHAGTCVTRNSYWRIMSKHWDFLIRIEMNFHFVRKCNRRGRSLIGKFRGNKFMKSPGP